MQKKILISIILSTVLAYPAAAQMQAPTSRPSPLMPLYQCLKIDDNTQRLLCLEQNTQSLRLREKNRELLAFDSKYAAKIRKEAFGFYLPSLPDMGIARMSNANTAMSQSQTFHVQSVRKAGRDYIFTMFNGQVWRQTSGGFDYIPHGNLNATITHRNMGEYTIMLSSDRENVQGMTVRRIK